MYGDPEEHTHIRQQIVDFMRSRCTTSLRLQTFMLEHQDDLNEKFENWE